MRATYMYGAGDVRVIDVPDPIVKHPTDALVRVVRSCICGSDLHPYHSMPVTPDGSSMGHECIGVVEDTGGDVTTVKRGDLVITPFAWSDGPCEFCREGLQTSCRHGGFWNSGDVDGLQAEAVRVPLADGTLVPVPVAEDSALPPSLLTLSDVYGTGYHAASKANVTPRTTVTVIGDGAVGLMAVLAAKRLGAERIILMGRHTTRTDLGREFGATDIVSERGDEGIAKVYDLTGGDGTHVVLEAVGHMPAYDQAIGVVRAGGVISRVGVPQYQDAAVGFGSLFGPNITLTGGPAPARAYIETLLPDILDGTVQPGRVFDREIALDELSRRAIVEQIDASLTRLGVDYVDLYQIHRFDPATPVEETMEALHDVVKAGKVRYIGASSMHAWQFAKLQYTADLHGWTRFVSMQNQYSLLQREDEREMFGLLADQGVTSIPWSPLAKGRLARPWGEQTARSQSDPVGRRAFDEFGDRDKPVVDAVARIADARGVPMAQIALAWVLRNPVVTAPIVGPTKPHHLADAIAALDITLNDDEAVQLEEHYTRRQSTGY